MKTSTHKIFLFCALPLVVLSVLCVTLGAGERRAFSGEAKRCMPVRNLSEKHLVFQAGEKLNYIIRFKWGMVNSDVATAEFSLDKTSLNGTDVFASRLFCKTAKFYDKFFKVREDFQSWFTTEGMVPQKFYRSSKEGKYFCTNDYKFLWNVGEPYISADIETSKRPMRTETIALDACTFDPLTLFYTARNMDMDKISVGQEYPLTFAVADDVYTVYFVFKGREQKVIKGVGTVKTLKFAIQVVEGDVFTGNSDLFMWFSDDENRIPVYFEASLKMGNVGGRLDSYSGLKHPFSAKIKR